MTSASAKLGRTKHDSKGRTTRKTKKWHKAQKQTTRRRISSFTTTNNSYVEDLYSETARDVDVDVYLKEADCYSTSDKTWSIPSAATEEELTCCVFSILSSIVRRFVKPTEPSMKREVINTYNISACSAKDEDGYRAYPTLCIQASGPSFERPGPSDFSLDTELPFGQLGFTDVATYFSVKRDSELGSVEDHVNEMASYAGIFSAQPNRLYVRCLVFTERHVRLIHFDRAGTQVTPPFDFHQTPHTFIRVVAGLSSECERVLGLDDSIQWSIVDGRKQQGTITTTGSNGEAKLYPIVDRIPIPQETISGRATTCWRVKDPENSKEYVVKDSWGPDDRPAEYELLERVKGITGVVQMVSYETSRPQTKDFRCPSTVGKYRNRVASRITTKSYGKTIEFFTSILQVLRAIRDAIAAHQRLVGDDVRILHRDISQHNILLGKDGAPEGERGILIDLDRAFLATDEKPETMADHNIGTRIFQSLSVLKSVDRPTSAPAHDYLDDLESFFYLLAYIFLLYKPDGSRVPSAEEGPSAINDWGKEQPAAAYPKKENVFGAGRLGYRCIETITAAWGPACGTLFTKFRRWVYEMSGDKIDIVHMLARGEECEPLASLLAHRDEHYSTVLTLFDDAIRELETSQSESKSAAPPSGELVVSVQSDGSPTNHPPLQTAPSLSDSSSSLSNPSTSASAPAPTTPPQVPATLPHHPMSPNRKRRSEDGEHPDSPDAKVGRRSDGEDVTTRSP